MDDDGRRRRLLLPLGFYNVFFPIWVFFAFPQVIWASLLINLVIDFVVLYLTLRRAPATVSSLDYGRLDSRGLDKSAAWRIAIRRIWPVWLLGFLADMIAALGLFLLTNIVVLGTRTAGTSATPAQQMWETVGEAIMMNPFRHPLSFLIILVFIVLAAFLIYVLNRYLSFRRLDISSDLKRHLALNLAIFTAPWFFLFPSILLWR